YTKRTAPTASLTNACSCSLSGRPVNRSRIPERMAFNGIVPCRRALLYRLVGKFLADRDHLVATVEQDIHQLGIEVSRFLVFHESKRVLHRPCRLVRPDRGERVVDVGERDDARFERDMLPFQTRGIAGTVVALVVPERDHCGHLEITR